jgi:plastocyanin
MPYRRLLFTLALAATALAGVPAAHAASFTINAMANASFSPNTLIIHPGDTVTWMNVGGGFHNVAADDGSFRNGDPSGAAWSFSRTFGSAGTVGYHCEIHGSPTGGMHGTITVQADTPNPQPGTVRFSQTGYSVTEGTAHATIAVSRSGGEDGAVSVAYATAAGTASAGPDFTAVSGTLTWADQDAADKTFQVPITNDTLVESTETVALTLSTPTGGAILDPARRTATLSILDNDSGGGGTAPAAPSNLRAAGLSTSEIQLNWNDNSNNETGFKIERKGLTGAYQEIATAGAGATSFVAGGLDPATAYTFRVRATNAAGNSAYSNEATAASNAPIGPCIPGPNTLCVSNGRFAITVDWRTATDSNHGNAVVVPTAPDSGLFYFFDAANLEMLIKVLNGCALTNTYWVFYAATTNVELKTTVIDSQTGKVKVYFNPLNTAAPPIQDTGALAVCP